MNEWQYEPLDRQLVYDELEPNNVLFNYVL
jgi:hypothetical protein